MNDKPIINDEDLIDRLTDLGWVHKPAKGLLAERVDLSEEGFSRDYLMIGVDDETVKSVVMDDKEIKLIDLKKPRNDCVVFRGKPFSRNDLNKILTMATRG